MKKQQAKVALAQEENLNEEGLEKVIGDYIFTEKIPLSDDVVKIMNERPKLKERKTVATRVIEKIKSFVETFLDGVD